MARLRHTIELASVSRADVERAIGVAHEVLESLRVQEGAFFAPDGRPVPGAVLRSGEHLVPGARYAFTESHGHTVEGELLHWDRDRETGATFGLTEHQDRAGDEGRASGARLAAGFRLLSARAPQRLGVSLEGELVRPDGARKRLRWFAARADLDLTRWWAATAGERGAGEEPALTARVRLPILRAAIQLVPRPAEGGGWLIEVLITIRGRGLARPVTFVPLLATKRMLDRAVGEALEKTAADWDALVAPELRWPPQELRHRLLNGLCRPREEPYDKPATDRTDRTA